MKLEADFDRPEVVDAHHHLWTIGTNPYPWLSGAAPGSLEATLAARSGEYGPDRYRRDVQPWGVVASVHVQADWDPRDPVGETRWLQNVHDRHGVPSAIVGAANLESPEVGRTLIAHARHGLFRGVRQVLAWHEDPTLRVAPRDDLMSDRAWQRGFTMLAPMGLSFDLHVYPGQLAQAARLAGDHRSTRIVVCHAGMPDETPDDRSVWREGMRRLAQCDNVTVKLSGITQPRRTVEHIREYVEEVLELFGCRRAMFGTNLPVEHLEGSVARLVDALDRSLAGRCAADRAAIWRDTARRVYRLEERPSAKVGSDR